MSAGVRLDQVNMILRATEYFITTFRRLTLHNGLSRLQVFKRKFHIGMARKIKVIYVL